MVPPCFRIIIGILFIYCLSSQASGQQKLGFLMPDGQTSVSFPFEVYSNLIVIPVTINGLVKVKFILDTGAESVILTEKLYGSLLGFNYVRSIILKAPGIQDSVKTLVATGVSLELPENLHGVNMNMLVLEEDYLRLHENLGEEIYGILGYDLFYRFVIHLDYDRQVITLHLPATFQPPKSYSRHPITIIETKPFLETKIQQGNMSDTIKLMLDLGASHSVLLDVQSTQHITYPSKMLTSRLGQGLGGEIPGFIGRLRTLSIDTYDFENVLVSIPTEGTYSRAIKRGSRHGTIGGDILSRFKLILDYNHSCIYLKKANRFDHPFEFDMSGLTLSASGQDLDSIQVAHIRNNTPAAESGILPGDHILKINGMNLYNSNLSDIHYLLRKSHGLRIRAVIWRDEQRIVKTFKLQRLI